MNVPEFLTLCFRFTPVGKRLQFRVSIKVQLCITGGSNY